MVSKQYFSCFVVPDRAYLEVNGKDAVKLIHSVSTNDITNLNSHETCIATAFLTPKGRILADALIYNITQPEEGPQVTRLLIETHKAVSAQLMKFLVMYRLRSVATIKVSHYQTTVVVGSEKNDTKGEVLVVTNDPRGSELGTLYLSPLGQAKECSANAVDKSMYTRYRMLHGIAEGPEIANKIPLECNLDLLNYISFSKGCYVGQELVARTKHKGIVRKRILPFLRLLRKTGGGGEKVPQPFEKLLPAVSEGLVKSTLLDTAPADSRYYVGEGDFLIAKDKDKNKDDEKEKDSGIVLATTRGQEMGLAMVRLSKLYCNRDGSKNENGPDESRAGFAVVSGSSNDESKNGSWSDSYAEVRVFRPSWWPDVDPVTGRAMSEM